MGHLRPKAIGPTWSHRSSSFPTQSRWVRWLLSSSFFFCYDLINFKIVFLSLYSDNLIMLERKKEAMERMREKKKSGRERKNWYNSSWYNFLIKKIQLLMYSSPLDLMSYCTWAKKILGFRESIGDPFFGLILYYREYFCF